MNKKLLIVLLIGLFLVEGAMAIGITPGRSTFDYSPGSVKNVDFSVINSEDKVIDVVVLVQGEFNESISVSEVSFSMQPGESKTLKYGFTMPPNLSPGSHLSEVVAVQLPGRSVTSEAFVGAAVGVATQIIVDVPYPGKYLDASLNVIGPSDDGEVTFVMPLLSRGELDVVKANAIVEIFGPFNDQIDRLNTNTVSVNSGERKEIVANWNPEVAPGQYRAVATLVYDEETRKIEKTFSVGERLLEIDGVDVNDFRLGGIAKFEVLVSNQWSDAINGVFAEMSVFNKAGEVMAEIKSPTYDIHSLEKKLMVLFWDTAGVSRGEYDATILLKYSDKSDQHDFKLDVRDDEINVIGIGYVISSEDTGGGLFGNGLVVFLVVIVVVLVIVNLLWFLYLRKKIAKK